MKTILFLLLITSNLFWFVTLIDRGGANHFNKEGLAHCNKALGDLIDISNSINHPDNYASIINKLDADRVVKENKIDGYIYFGEIILEFENNKLLSIHALNNVDSEKLLKLTR